MLSIIKRIGHAVLATAILSSALPVALADTEPDIYFYEGFNNSATNAVPQTFTVSGNKNSRIVENGEKEKALYLDTYGYYNSLNIKTATKSVNYVFSMDMMFESSAISGSVSFNGLSAIIKFQNGRIVLSNGKNVCGVPTGKMTNISIGYCTENNRYFVSVDNTEIESYVISEKSIGDLSSVAIEINDGEDKEKGVYIDNICVYDSPRAIKGVGKKISYSTKTEEFKPTEYNPEAVTSFIEQDFESDNLSNLTIVKNSSDFTIETEENGNRYYRMDMKSDGYISLYASPMRYVVWQMDMKYESKCPVFEFRLRDSALVNWDYNLRTTAAGAVNDHTNIKIVNLKENAWTNVAMVFDMRNLTYKVYIDGELKKNETPIGNQKFGKFSFFRLYTTGQELGTLCLDNIKVYESKELISDSAGTEEEKGAIPDTSFSIAKKFETTESDKALISGAVALSATTDSLFDGSKKIKLSAKPYVTDGYTMIPVRAVSEAFGVDVEWNADDTTIKIGDNSLMTVGSKIMKKNGVDITLNAAPEIKNDTAFIPLRDLGEKILGKEVYYDEEFGLIVISDSKWAHTEKRDIKRQVYNYLFFDRATAEELKNIYKSSGMENVHPRIVATTNDFENISNQYKAGDKYMTSWVNHIIAKADLLLAQPKLSNGKYDTASFAQYKPPEMAKQLLYEARDTLMRVKYLGFAYKITNNSAYARRAADELMHVCGWNDWRPSSFLCTAEMSFAVALGYDWCYEQLTEEERAYMEEALIKNGIYYGIDFYNGITHGSTDFTTAEHNWNFVGNGGMIAASLAICDKYPNMSFRMIEVALGGVERAMASFAPDGGWGEGPMYWDYTMQYSSYMFSMLKSGLGTDFDIPDYKGFENTWQFWAASTFNKGSNNYHDATSGDNYLNSHWLMFIAQRFKNEKAKNAVLVASDSFGGVPDVTDTPETCIWYSRVADKKEADSGMLPLDSTIKGVEAGAMRSSWSDKNAFAIGFHGGWTAVNHHHIDSGTYIIEMGGQRFVSELGSDNYSLPNYIGGEKGIYRKRVESHALFVIDPSDDGGQNVTNTFSEIIKTQSKNKGAFQIMDLQNSYAPRTKSAKRGFMLTDNRHSIIVQDDIELSEGNHDVYWFVPTESSNIEIVDDKTAILTRYDVKAQVQLVTDIPGVKFIERACTPLLDNISNFSIQNQNTGFKQLCVEAKGVSGSIKLAMRYTLLEESYSELEYNLVPVDSWEIPDGELEELPMLDAIYIDDKLIEGFSRTKNAYTLYYGRGVDLNNIQLTYDISEPDCDVTLNREGNTYSIKVQKKNSDIYFRYNIDLIAIGDSYEVGDYTTYEIWNVNVSEEPQPQNHRYNVIDNNTSTYWGAQYDGQWIELDIGSVQPIEGIGYSFMNGAERKYTVDIVVSDDGVNYKNVFSGQLGGVTTNYEVLELKNVSARYIKLIGHGNTTNAWNSIGEFTVLHK